jgi:hypothetical protein
MSMPETPVFRIATTSGPKRLRESPWHRWLPYTANGCPRPLAVPNLRQIAAEQGEKRLSIDSLPCAMLITSKVEGGIGTMKGVIALALKELVESSKGEAVWKQVLTGAGIGEEPVILPTNEVDDDTIVRLIESLCKVTGMALDEAGMAFGDYWVNTYSQRLYGHFYRKPKNAREFLLTMDDVHLAMTKNLRDAKPPRFRFDQQDDVLVMEYLSTRRMLHLMVGLIYGVGRFFNEKLEVTPMANDRVSVRFTGRPLAS